MGLIEDLTEATPRPAKPATTDAVPPGIASGSASEPDTSPSDDPADREPPTDRTPG
jgi:hypothetical protein